MWIENREYLKSSYQIDNFSWNKKQFVKWKFSFRPFHRNVYVSYFGIRMSFTIVNYKLKYQNVNYRIFFPHLKLVEDSDDNKHACHWINISDVNMLTFDLIHFWLSRIQALQGIVSRTFETKMINENNPAQRQIVLSFVCRMHVSFE